MDFSGRRHQQGNEGEDDAECEENDGGQLLEVGIPIECHSCNGLKLNEKQGGIAIVRFCLLACQSFVSGLEHRGVDFVIVATTCLATSGS